MNILVALLSALLCVGTFVTDDTQKKEIEKSIIVPASVEQVWQAWTTAEGLQTFFAPKAVVDPKPGGEFSIIFTPDAPEGQRGAEGMRVLKLSFEEKFSFSWNNPPQFEKIRDKQTRVTVSFKPTDDGKTVVTLVHDRFKKGKAWSEAYAYFDDAWEVVLGRLQHRFEVGPIDWADPWSPPAPQAN